MIDAIASEIEVYCLECVSWIRAEAVMPLKGPAKRYLRMPLHKRGKHWCSKSKMVIQDWWKTRKYENPSEHGIVQETP
jgi:hypothetical protein